MLSRKQQSLIPYVLIDTIFTFITDAHVCYVCLNMCKRFWNHLPETVIGSNLSSHLFCWFVFFYHELLLLQFIKPNLGSFFSNYENHAYSLWKIIWTSPGATL